MVRSGDGPPEAQARGGVRILLAPNASPYNRSKREGREQFAFQVARRNGIPLVYANLVGGQDDIVFHGSSLVVGADGELLYRAPALITTRPTKGSFGREVARVTWSSMM